MPQCSLKNSRNSRYSPISSRTSSKRDTQRLPRLGGGGRGALLVRLEAGRPPRDEGAMGSARDDGAPGSWREELGPGAELGPAPPLVMLATARPDGSRA